jgi:1-pyrroline-5-carboxylate dehydrogenase
MKDGLLSIRSQLKLGSPLDFETFLSAVIDKSSFDNISNYISEAKSSQSHTILGGGNVDDSVGYYIEPTIIQTTDPKSKLLREEIFGPVLTVYVYNAKQVKEALELVDNTSDFALTGAIFGQDS